jgi:4-amino-4-deoxy-L-arabinose transferase-like glycosyltransferase
MYSLGVFFFVAQRDPQWNASLIASPFALKQLDTEWYFQPLDEWQEIGKYTSVCKLPGFAPIYMPLRWIMSKSAAYNVICVLQLLLDALCTVVLATMAFRFFKSRAMYFLVFGIYALSTFISVRSNYVLSDSFCTSFFVLSMAALQSGLDNGRRSMFVWSGLALMWSFEMRPVMLVVFPVVLVLILAHSASLRQKLLRISLIFFPLLVVTLWWNIHNRLLHNRSLWLIAPVEECMSHYGPQSAAIRRFVIAIGEDFQPWSKGSAAEWFLKRNMETPPPPPFELQQMASTYNLDTLIGIRSDYKRIERGEELTHQFKNELMLRMDRCTEAYRREHGLDYYLINRLGFLKMFLFPKRIDDLPLPAVDQMNILQKIIKAGSWLALLCVNGFGVLGWLLALRRYGWVALWWSGLGAAPIVVLSAIGFIEQRYLTAVYPVMAVFAAYACYDLWSLFKSFIHGRDIPFFKG